MLMVSKELLNLRRRVLLLLDKMDMYLFVNILGINYIGKTLRSGERLKIYLSIFINENIVHSKEQNMKELLLNGIVWH